MATKKSQRIFTIIIGVFMILSTVGLYVGMILSSQNEDKDRAALQQKMAEIQKKSAKIQEKIAANQKKQEKVSEPFNDKYGVVFKKYKDYPTAFNSAQIKKVMTKDLKVGTGSEIKKDTKYRAYYVGWLSSGKTFDSSFNGDKLRTPIAGGNLITGWNEGVIGMKMGGVREIAIPPEKAYGDQAKGNIPANSTLKFVVMVVDPIKQLDELDKEYNKLFQESLSLYVGQ